MLYYTKQIIFLLVYCFFFSSFGNSENCDKLYLSFLHVTLENHITFQPLEWHVIIGAYM